MKKFLTVLLALSVVFTYTVGTAFAAAGDPPVKADAAQAKLLAEAKTYAEGLVTSNYDTAYKAVVEKTLQYSPTSISKKAAWDTINVKATIQAFIDKAYVDAANDYGDYTSITDKKELAGKVFATANGFISETNGTPAIASNEIVKVMFDLCEVSATIAAFNADRDDALSAFDKIDYSAYSDTKVDKESGKTYLALAKEKAEAGKENLSKQEVYDAETFDKVNLANLNGSMANFKGGANSFYTGGVAYYLTEKTVNVNGTPVGLGIYTVNGVKTNAQLDNDDITDAATAAQIKATAQSAYAKYIVKDGADKEFAKAYVDVVSYLADKGVIKNYTEANLSDTNVFTATVKKLYKDAVDNAADMDTFAAKYAAERNAEGTLVRDAKKVAEIAEEYKIAEYKYGAGLANAAPDATTYKKKIVDATISTLEAGLTFAKEVAKASLAKAKADVIDDYYSLEAAKVEANYAKTLAAIEAATTVDKVKAIDVRKEALIAGIDKKDTVDSKVNFTTGAPKAALEAVQAYIAYANTGKTVLNAEYINATDAEIKAQIAKIYGEAGARKPSEMSATKVDVNTVVAALPTVGGLDAAKKAADEAIKALPAKVTVADKDAVIAAWKLANTYNDMKEAAGSTVALDDELALTNAVTKLFADMQYDFAKKIAAVSKTDKEALKALQAELDDANDLIAKDEIFENKSPEFDNAKVVATALKSIRDAELKAVKAAINAIPVNVTEADKATVEAARKAYDAFVKDWTVYEAYDNYDAAAAVDNFRTLALAEAALGLNADPGKDVEALKITASSTAGKGYIKVKWTVKGNAEAADGYQVYRSVKRNSGFGTKPYFTTKNKTYKNTKSLKKGKRYYYKVRAYKVVDGKKVYSDWSNKAYRIAK